MTEQTKKRVWIKKIKPINVRLTEFKEIIYYVGPAVFEFYESHVAITFPISVNYKWSDEREGTYTQNIPWTFQKREIEKYFQYDEL